MSGEASGHFHWPRIQTSGVSFLSSTAPPVIPFFVPKVELLPTINQIPEVTYNMRKIQTGGKVVPSC